MLFMLLLNSWCCFGDNKNNLTASIHYFNCLLIKLCFCWFVISFFVFQQVLCDIECFCQGPGNFMVGLNDKWRVKKWTNNLIWIEQTLIQTHVLLIPFGFFPWRNGKLPQCSLKIRFLLCFPKSIIPSSTFIHWFI